MARFSVAPICALAPLMLLACSDAGPEWSTEAPVASDEAAIINGNKDTTHQAVVLVSGSNNSACSGTIISVKSGAGYVLTAAHCGNPQFVLQGNDYNNPTAYYPATKYQRHSGWTGQPPNYDFMMVQISGVNGSTPVIPAMSPGEDSLGVGTQIRHVGYGKSGPAPGSATSQRHEIVGTLSGVQALTVTYNQPNGGPCSGDSGGPQLTLSNERVASVTSAGDQDCKTSGVSGRTSAVYNTFIMPFINNSPPAQQTCDQCTQGATTGQSSACYGAVDACLKNSSCSGLMDCLQKCGQNDQACVNQCAKTYSAGVNKYLAIFDCVCDTACKVECDGEPMCQGGSPPPPSSSSSSSTSTSSSSTSSSGTGGSDPTSSGTGGDPNTTGPPGNESGWVAGDTNKKKYGGSVMLSQCAARWVGSRGSGSATWLAMLGVFALLARRRQRH